MAREHFDAALDRQQSDRFRTTPGHTRVYVDADCGQVAGNRELEKSGHHDVPELAGLWRWSYLRSLNKEEGPVFCHRRQDWCSEMDHRRTRRRARFIASYSAARHFSD